MFECIAVYCEALIILTPVDCHMEIARVGVSDYLAGMHCVLFGLVMSCREEPGLIHAQTSCCRADAGVFVKSLMCVADADGASSVHISLQLLLSFKTASIYLVSSPACHSVSAALLAACLKFKCSISMVGNGATTGHRLAELLHSCCMVSKQQLLHILA